MPLIPLVFIGGALTGGAATWFVSDTSKKIATAAIGIGALWYLHKKGAL